VQAAVIDLGGEVSLGGELYSDALGSAGSPAGTYIGMVRTNTETIVAALK
jgi:manganese/zinc/iron transport system substrate-binding protein